MEHRTVETDSTTATTSTSSSVQCMLDAGVSPEIFQRIHNAVRKPYTQIALLNTVGKALEKIMATRISFAAEEFKLLPRRQMGGRRTWGTEHALLGGNGAATECNSGT